MLLTEASAQASALQAAHGDKAEVVVGTNIRACQSAGRHDEAETWKMIQRALRQRRGASES